MKNTKNSQNAEETEIMEFARNRLTETSGEKVSGINISEYGQIHLAIACSGKPEDYIARAAYELAKKALHLKCELAVDADYCQNNPKGSVILVATGLRKKNLEQKVDEKTLPTKDFADKNISHISASEFLNRISQTPEYNSFPIGVSYAGKPTGDYLRNAELSLARIAIEKGYSFVTNIDYVLHVPESGIVKIEATGLKKKSNGKLAISKPRDL